jgi:hypothetical protein
VIGLLEPSSSKGLGWAEIRKVIQGDGFIKHVLEFQSDSLTPKQVEEVKLVLRMLPVFFTTVLYA